MKIKFTPGPWYILHNAPPAGRSTQIKDEGTHGVICLLKTSKNNKEANGNLIAAAPEMLMALIACEKLFAAKLAFPEHNLKHPIWAARRAIISAIGGMPDGN